MFRYGKIARLPEPLRTDVNRALQRGDDTATVLDWLNREPRTLQVLRKWFQGRPVSPQNLSHWRRGGYENWRRHQQACQMAHRMVDQFDGMEEVLEGRPLSNRISRALMAELIGLMEVVGREAPTAAQRLEQLGKAVGILHRIQQAEARTGRLTLDRIKAETKAMEKVIPWNRRHQVEPVMGLLLKENARCVLASSPGYDPRVRGLLDECFGSEQALYEKKAPEEEEETGDVDFEELAMRPMPGSEKPVTAGTVAESTEEVPLPSVEGDAIKHPEAESTPINVNQGMDEKTVLPVMDPCQTAAPAGVAQPVERVPLPSVEGDAIANPKAESTPIKVNQGMNEKSVVPMPKPVPSAMDRELEIMMMIEHDRAERHALFPRYRVEPDVPWR